MIRVASGGGCGSLPPAMPGGEAPLWLQAKKSAGEEIPPGDLEPYPEASTLRTEELFARFGRICKSTGSLCDTDLLEDNESNSTSPLAPVIDSEFDEPPGDVGDSAAQVLYGPGIGRISMTRITSLFQIEKSKREEAEDEAEHQRRSILLWRKIDIAKLGSCPLVTPIPLRAHVGDSGKVRGEIEVSSDPLSHSGPSAYRRAQLEQAELQTATDLTNDSHWLEMMRDLEHNPVMLLAFQRRLTADGMQSWSTLIAECMEQRQEEKARQEGVDYGGGSGSGGGGVDFSCCDEEARLQKELGAHWTSGGHLGEEARSKGAKPKVKAKGKFRWADLEPDIPAPSPNADMSDWEDCVEIVPEIEPAPPWHGNSRKTRQTKRKKERLRDSLIGWRHLGLNACRRALSFLFSDAIGRSLEQ